MNGLLSNEEAECGLNPNSEDLDLDAEEDDGLVSSRTPFQLSEKSYDDGKQETSFPIHFNKICIS